MKNIKLIVALIAVLLSNVASMEAMSRLLSVPRRITQKGVRTNIRLGRTKISKKTEKEINDAIDKEINEYFSASGHTPLFELITDVSLDPEERIRGIKKLCAQGAVLNDQDRYMLGYTGHLGFLLNMSNANPTAINLEKVFRTSETKTMEQKLEDEVLSEPTLLKLSQYYEKLQLKKIRRNTHNNAVSAEGLLVKREEERAELKRARLLKKQQQK